MSDSEDEMLRGAFAEVHAAGPRPIPFEDMWAEAEAAAAEAGEDEEPASRSSWPGLALAAAILALLGAAVFATSGPPTAPLGAPEAIVAEDDRERAPEQPPEGPRDDAMGPTPYELAEGPGEWEGPTDFLLEDAMEEFDHLYDETPTFGELDALM